MFGYLTQGVFETREDALSQGPWVKDAEFGTWFPPGHNHPIQGWICLTDERPD